MPRRAALAIALLTAATAARAERLPIRTYSTADGLAHDTVHRIVQDSRGFLWFCTDGGLSRFDGYGFTSYTRSEGLPSNQVNDLVEAHDGAYWIATSGGLVRFDPAGRGGSGADPSPVRFTLHTLGQEKGDNQVLRVAEDERGAMWAGTTNGLHRLEPEGARWAGRRVDLGIPPAIRAGIQINALLPDGRGGLWFGTRRGGIFHMDGQGRLARHCEREDSPGDNVRALLREPDGSIRAATRAGLLHVELQARTGAIRVLSRHTGGGLPIDFTTDLLRTQDGRLYVATPRGVGIAEPGGSPLRFRSIGEPEGLIDLGIDALAQDRSGNLWMGSQTRGVMKLAVDGFVSYGPGDGLAAPRHAAFLESRRGDLVVMSTNERREILLSRFDGARFHPVRVNIPRVNPGWGWHQVALQDHLGEWWIPTSEGIFRFASTDDLSDLATAKPFKRFRSDDGIGYEDVFRLFEDSRGDVWMSAEGLLRWERRTGVFHRCSLPGGKRLNWAGSFAEDRSGTLWMSLWGGNLVRYRDGKFIEFTVADGLPPGSVTMVHVDGSGRLWVATDEGGVARADDPAPDRPAFRIYSTREGLASNEVSAVTEDRSGRIYLATGRGVDRLDPGTGRIRHFTTADGLLVNRVGVAYADRRGDVWFASYHGVSRLSPGPDPPRPPPPVLIDAVRVAGVPRAISPLGEQAITGLALGPAQRQIEVEFVGLDFTPGEVLNYQYRLEGIDAGWSALSDRRSVNYASLAPGSYRFAVRAINSAGQPSVEPATVSFRVLPPFWRRWWFLTGAAMAVAGAAAGAYRLRVSRLIEMERVRTRIATDLHDDIGASLSQIAILSEVTRRRAGAADPAVASSLEKIAAVSGELVDSMSDIVWAINPRRDRLGDLTQRMRWFASDLLGSRDLRFEFAAPETGLDMHLDADVRRHLYLVFKEALNNIVKHSGASSVRAELKREKDRIVLCVADDGAGFDPAAAARGHGLASMRDRARAARGSIRIDAQPSGGCRLTLEIPLSRHWSASAHQNG